MNTDGFLARLSRGPIVLMLGQAYLRLETGIDPLLSQIYRRYLPEKASSQDYSDILGISELQDDRATAVPWIHARAEKASVPEWLHVVAQYPWNSVYSSAVDLIWPRAFSNPWRAVQPILDPDYVPSNPRSRSKLHCTYMFGRLGDSEEEARSPLSQWDYRQRLRVAEELANRLAELVTPFGTLVIEGYDELTDWFPKDRLALIFDDFAEEQVHVFSQDQLEFSLDQAIPENVRRAVCFHSQGLAEVLLEGQARGLIVLGEEVAGEGYDRAFPLGKSAVEVPAPIWNEVAKSATLLAERHLVQPDILSEDATYHEFRAFLGDPVSKGSWEGYARGFPFLRHFQIELKKKVLEALESPREDSSRAIVVHGQTGTGKTLALYSLAYEMLNRRQWPVVVIHRHSTPPDIRTLAEFCRWAEAAGASAVLLVWDGMRKPDLYERVLQQLQSRGRHAVVVGSCYEKGAPGFVYVEAPASLEKDEANELLEHISGFGMSISEHTRRAVTGAGRNCLNALYRLLPASRRRIETGVVGEVTASQEELIEALKNLQIDGSASVQLAEEMIRAGIIDAKDLLHQEEEKLLGEGSQVALSEQIIAHVLVPGQFNLSVPIELLARTSSKKTFREIPRLVEQLSIFYPYEDESGEIYVGARTALEATLYVRARFGGAAAEVAFAGELVRKARRRGGHGDGPEIDFAIDLLHKMGPNGQYQGRYWSHFPELADAASELATAGGVDNPRIMLQEATLRREWVKRARDRVGLSEKTKCLGQAIGTLERAVKLAESRNRALRCSIEVELASQHGAWLYLLHRSSDSEDNAEQHIEAVVEHANKARALDPTSYYPIDVLAWNVEDIVGKGDISSTQKIELIADVLSAFDGLDPTVLPPGQAVEYHKKRLRLGSMQGDIELTTNALDSLEQLGSTAGIYLQAIRLSGLLEAEHAPADANAIGTALRLLRDNSERIRLDPRCLFLCLRLWWLEHLAASFFAAEKQTPALSEACWQEFAQLLLAYRRANAEAVDTPNPTAEYLLAVAYYHLGLLPDADEIFAELKQDPDFVLGRARLRRYFVLSTEEGHPQVFDGEVQRMFADGSKGDMFIRDLRRSIPFMARDFSPTTLRAKDARSDIAVVFNHMGPLACPVHTLRPGGSRNERQRRRG